MKIFICHWLEQAYESWVTSAVFAQYQAAPHCWSPATPTGRIRNPLRVGVVLVDGGISSIVDAVEVNTALTHIFRELLSIVIERQISCNLWKS